MKSYNVFLACALMALSSQIVFGQIAINTDNSTPDFSAILDIKSTEKGLLIPRMTQWNRTMLISPAQGLLIYQTDETPGFYYNSGSASIPAWVKIGTGSNWSLTGNSGTVAGTNFIGTTDNVSLVFKVNNSVAGKIDQFLSNTSFGMSSLHSNITGSANVAIGESALTDNLHGSNNTAIGINAMAANQSGSQNTAIGGSTLRYNTGNANTATGQFSLCYNTTGEQNTANGLFSLTSNTAASRNTAIGAYTLFTQSYNPGSAWYSENVAVGAFSLYSNQPLTENNGNKNTAVGSFSAFTNSTGRQNTSLGYNSLYSNTTGNSIVAIGAYALHNNTTASYLVAVGDSALFKNGGVQNTAIGSRALTSNTSGNYNTASGYRALLANTSGSYNTANGVSALLSNEIGWENTAIGCAALVSNFSGGSNTVVGAYSMYSNNAGYRNTAVGQYSNYYTTSDDNTSVGYSAGDWYYFSNGTFLGSNAKPSVNYIINCMALGYNASVDASNKVVVGNADITSIGGYAGWTTFPSDRAFKKNVSDNVPGLSFISLLHPVTYNVDVKAINEELNSHRPSTMREGQQKKEETPEERESAEAKSRIVYTGFIAQDVEAAAKSIGYEFSGVDAPKSADGHYGLRYAEFVVPLVKAVQEQQAMIEDLRSRNEKLQLQNEQMMKRIEALEGK